MFQRYQVSKQQRTGNIGIRRRVDGFSTRKRDKFAGLESQWASRILTIGLKDVELAVCGGAEQFGIAQDLGIRPCNDVDQSACTACR